MGSLVLQLPSIVMSLLVVAASTYVVQTWLGIPFWFPLTLWVISGALVFHRPSEQFLARHLFRLRYPTKTERSRLEPVWREVTGRAGVNGSSYQLWIEDSKELNAISAAGHIVGVTSYALNELPTGQLAAVLAHELGHHKGGHAWASLLAYWYALPGRLAWQLLRRLIAQMSHFSPLASGVLVVCIAAAVFAAATATMGLVLLPVLTPYLVAALGRRAELRADRHAATLGFAPMMIDILNMMVAEDASARASAAAKGLRWERDAPMARLLSSHPSLHTRLHHLQAIIEDRR